MPAGASAGVVDDAVEDQQRGEGAEARDDEPRVDRTLELSAARAQAHGEQADDDRDQPDPAAVGERIPAVGARREADAADRRRCAAAVPLEEEQEDEERDRADADDAVRSAQPVDVEAHWVGFTADAGDPPLGRPGRAQARARAGSLGRRVAPLLRGAGAARAAPGGTSKAVRRGSRARRPPVSRRRPRAPARRRRTARWRDRGARARERLRR